MPDTRGFETVAEVREEVLLEMLKAAWDSGGDGTPGTIPHEVDFTQVTLGPYQTDHGQVQIPREGLSLDMAPAQNGVTVGLSTTIQAALDPNTIPVSSLSLLTMSAGIAVTAPFGIVPGTGHNVCILFDGLPRNQVTTTLTSGDPIGPITLDLIKEYVHKLYEDETIPHTITLEDQSYLNFTFDVFMEFFDDLDNPAREITVQQPDANHVTVSIPVHLRLSQMQGPGGLPLPGPTGIYARLVINAPYEHSAADGKVKATLTAATVTVEDITPADGVEGINYNLNKAGAQALGMDLDAMMSAEISAQGTLLVQAMGDIEILVPTVSDLEALIGDQVHQELLQRSYMGAWTPETPSGSPVQIQSVRPKALSECLAIGINPGSGADENLLSNFIPSGQAFGVALDGDFVIQTIGDIVNRPESEGGFGGIPKHFDDIDGHEVDLTELHWELRSGAIHFWGEVTVHDVFCKADADVSFWADIGLRWSAPDAQGRQSLEPYVIDKDADLPWWAWLLAVLGFLVGIIVGVVSVVIVAVIERVVERVGGAVMEDEVSGQVQAIGAWPQQLQGIGTVTATFQTAVGIDSTGLLFSGSMLVTSGYALTAVASQPMAGGPYSGKAASSIHIQAGLFNPDIGYHWKLGDGHEFTGHQVSHDYIDDGIYVVRLTATVNQPGGATTHDSVQVRVDNVPPLVNAGPDMVVDEGQEVTFSGSFTDPEWVDRHEAIWDFGDDALPQRATLSEINDPPQAEGVATATHAYCDSGEYVATLRVRDDDGGVSEDRIKVTVRNVPPSVDAGDEVFAYHCTPIDLVAYFTDPGWCDKHTATWNTGDCTPTLPAVVREVNEPPEAYGIAVVTHTYNKCGVFQAECTVIDDDGGLGKDTLLVRVVDLLNRDFEGGFRNRNVGEVANEWEPYVTADQQRAGMLTAGTVGNVLFNAEEFVVRGGQRAQRISGTGPFRAGIYQQVGTNPGWDYQVMAWYHLDERRHGVCRLGVDPKGGVDPNASDVVWVEGDVKGLWAQLLTRVTAQSKAITVFLETLSREGGLNGYFDSVKLSPFPCPLKDPERRIEEEEEEDPEPESRCVDWRDAKTAQDMGNSFVKNGFTFQSLSQLPLRIVLWGDPEGQGKLVVLERGMCAFLPFAADRVTARIVTYYGKDPVGMEALDDSGGLVDQKVAEPDEGRIQLLEINGENITKVRFSRGGGESLLIELCAYLNQETARKIYLKSPCGRRYPSKD